VTYNNIYDLNAALFDQAFLPVMEFCFVPLVFLHRSILIPSAVFTALCVLPLVVSCLPSIPEQFFCITTSPLLFFPPFPGSPFQISNLFFLLTDSSLEVFLCR